MTKASNDSGTRLLHDGLVPRHASIKRGSLAITSTRAARCHTEIVQAIEATARTRTPKRPRASAATTTSATCNLDLSREIDERRNQQEKKTLWVVVATAVISAVVAIE